MDGVDVADLIVCVGDRAPAPYPAGMCLREAMHGPAYNPLRALQVFSDANCMLRLPV